MKKFAPGNVCSRKSSCTGPRTLAMGAGVAGFGMWQSWQLWTSLNAPWSHST